jgi:hypothetical protein
MPILIIVLIVLGLIFFGLGFAVTALKWLIYLAIILVVVAVIAWLWRTISRRR